MTRSVVLLIFAASLTGCGSCGGDQIKKESQRVWGKDKLEEEIAQKAKETIDAHALDERPDLKSRVLTMRFEEVVARLGFVEYKGKARFLLKRNGHTIDVPENTLIKHGVHGSFLVRQTDQDGAVTREVIYNNGILYGRNGNTGEMRVLGSIPNAHRKIRDEAWQSLRVFTGYYGPRVGLSKLGTASVKGRSAVQYDLVLRDGSPTIKVPGMKGEKKPISLKGKLYVDEATGVPLKANLQGKLEIPPGEKSKNPNPGVLDLSLSYEIVTVEGEELKPAEYVPTISRREVDLDPLAFLEGETRTSTVIGGKKQPAPKPPPEPAETKAPKKKKKKKKKRKKRR